MQLLKIRTIPFEYDMTIQNAKLTTPQIEPAKMSVETTPLQIENKTENVKIRMDSSDMRRSMGIKTAAERAKEVPAKTQQAVNNATARYVQQGNTLAQQGMSVAEYMKQKVLSDATSYNTVVTAIPSESVDVSWEPASIKQNVRRSSADINWQKSDQQMEFIPSSITVEVRQLADVEIEYLGGFRYVPPSSDPNYTEK